MIFTENKTGNHYIKQNKLDQKKDKYIIETYEYEKENTYILTAYIDTYNMKLKTVL